VYMKRGSEVLFHVLYGFRPILSLWTHTVDTHNKKFTVLTC
jgi:hypothetical protein